MQKKTGTTTYLTSKHVRLEQVVRRSATAEGRKEENTLSSNVLLKLKSLADF
jgi:hypothetical protein